MQKKDKVRATAKTHAQIMKEKQDMSLPINKFLNTFNEDKTVKYPMAQKIRKYAIVMPDPVLNDMRMVNALLHELRYHKEMSIKYLYESKKEHGIELRGKDGNVLTSEECYLTYISETQQEHTVLSKLRENLVTKLLSKCSNDFFTLDMYNEYLTKVDKIVTDLGHVLFPEEITMIEPL